MLGNAATLSILDLGENRLSGSSSPEFCSWQRLVMIALIKNSLDWDLSLIGCWMLIEFVLLQEMSITGTLPVTMLIGRNKISGTIGQQAFNTAISLSYLLISQNRISGSLP